ncbi:MAG: hypothetical protein M0R06_00825 [Sphaerochaeta sp.]|nr:hypothetical protein [Sphaerochaeta sp.]
MPKWVVELAKERLVQQVVDAEDDLGRDYSDKTIREFYESHYMDLGAINEMLAHPVVQRVEE